MDEHYRHLPLNPLRVFAIASRHKTFTAAAQHMGVSQVAVSRQITALEEYLGVQLFHRGSRAVQLTEQGRVFGREVSRIFDDLEQATGRVLSHESENTITLKVYPTMAQYWLMPHLAAFRAQYPQYKFRLDTTLEPLDFRGTQLDLSIQRGHGAWPDSKSRHLFDEVVDVVCSPDYAKAHGGFATPEDLRGCGLLHPRYRRAEWDAWLTQSGIDLSDLESQEFDTATLAYQAAEAGLGLALGQVVVLERALARGNLVTPFNKPLCTGAGFHIVWPTMKSVAPKTRAFVDWLLDATGQEPQFQKAGARPNATKS